jgi:hypothetical protein
MAKPASRPYRNYGMHTNSAESALRHESFAVVGRGSARRQVQTPHTIYCEVRYAVEQQHHLSDTAFEGVGTSHGSPKRPAYATAPPGDLFWMEIICGKSCTRQFTDT